MTAASEIERQTVLIAGGGVMGNGIAQVFAVAGHDVVLADLSSEALERATRRIERGLGRMTEKGDINAEAAADATARISTTTDLEAAGPLADYVIETVTEDLAVKQELLGRLDAVAADEVVFASNTSQFSITQIASATGRPDRVIGTHWFNPPPVMDLVEVVRGIETSEATLDRTISLLENAGKQVVVCKKDTQGFITSRLIMVLALEAARIEEEGIADAADINRACVLAFNHAMGPLDTIDLSGLDTVLRVAEAMTDHYGDRFRAPQNLRGLVSAGHYGRKTGRGFSDYGEAR